MFMLQVARMRKCNGTASIVRFRCKEGLTDIILRNFGAFHSFGAECLTSICTGTHMQASAVRLRSGHGGR